MTRGVIKPKSLTNSIIIHGSFGRQSKLKRLTREFDGQVGRYIVKVRVNYKKMMRVFEMFFLIGLMSHVASTTTFPDGKNI